MEYDSPDPGNTLHRRSVTTAIAATALAGCTRSEQENHAAAGSSGQWDRTKKGQVPGSGVAILR